MTQALVLGASGATGKLLVTDLLQRNIQVIAIVRVEKASLSIHKDHANYTEITAAATELSEQEWMQHLKGCNVVLSCLGHNLTFKGMFGQPKRLVTDTIATVSKVIEALQQNHKVKIILMNTTGNSNRDIPEKPPLSQKIVTAILRNLLPPHIDNEQAADFLRTQIGQDHQHINWVAVRPDGLIDQEEVTKYEIHTSPTRNPIFDAGQTSRINVANFMADLATNSAIWQQWQGKMPVIYNQP